MAETDWQRARVNSTTPARLSNWIAARPGDASRLQLLLTAVGDVPSLVQEWTTAELVPSPESAMAAATTILDTAQQETDAQRTRCRFQARWVNAESVARGQTVLNCSPERYPEEAGSADSEPSKQGIVEHLMRHEENHHKQSATFALNVLQQTREIVTQANADRMAAQGMALQLGRMCIELIEKLRDAPTGKTKPVSATEEAYAVSIAAIGEAIAKECVPAIPGFVREVGSGLARVNRKAPTNGAKANGVKKMDGKPS